LTIVIDHGIQIIIREERRLTMEKIPISKFKATCLRLLGNVKKTGHPLLVTRKGEPIALITPPPPPPKPKSWLGCLKDTIKITGDVVSPASDEKDWEVLQD
jgi:antitoxin (DNA-binding transcriptional repressor) of toxin-antitoxin stability system